MSVTDLAHGKYTTYFNHGCRCPECTADATRHTTEWRKKNRQRDNENRKTRQQAKDVLARRYHLEYREIVTAIRAGEVVE